MNDLKLSVRELEITDHEKIVDYFLNSDQDFLVGMGVDVKKFPSKNEWLMILADDFYLSIEQKKFYFIIW